MPSLFFQIFLGMITVNAYEKRVVGEGKARHRWGKKCILQAKTYEHWVLLFSWHKYKRIYGPSQKVICLSTPSLAAVLSTYKCGWAGGAA